MVHCLDKMSDDFADDLVKKGEDVQGCRAYHGLPGFVLLYRILVFALFQVQL